MCLLICFMSILLISAFMQGEKGRRHLQRFNLLSLFGDDTLKTSFAP